MNTQEKLKLCLEKASNEESLACHILSIEKMIEENRQDVVTDV